MSIIQPLSGPELESYWAERERREALLALEARGAHILSERMGLARVAIGDEIHQVSVFFDDLFCATCGQENCPAIRVLRAHREGDWPPAPWLSGGREGIRSLTRCQIQIRGVPSITPMPRWQPVVTMRLADVEDRELLTRYKAWHSSRLRQAFPPLEKKEKEEKRSPETLLMGALAIDHLPLLCHRQGSQVLLSPQSAQAALAMEEIEQIHKIPLPQTVWDWTLQSAEEIEHTFVRCGFAIELDRHTQGFLQMRRCEVVKNQYALDRLSQAYPEHFRRLEERMQAYHLDQVLYDFQTQDALTLAFKDRSYLAYVMGLGKTRTALVAALLTCIIPQEEERERQRAAGRTELASLPVRPVLIVAPERTLQLAWEEEFARLGMGFVDPQTGEVNSNGDEGPLSRWTYTLVKHPRDLDTPAHFHVTSYLYLSRREQEWGERVCRECGFSYTGTLSCPHCGTKWTPSWLCPVCGNRGTGRSKRGDAWTGYCERCGTSERVWVPPLYKSMVKRHLYSGVIFDEATYMKNRASLRSGAGQALRKVGWVCMLSGTPIRGQIDSIYWPLWILLKGHSPAFQSFEYEGGMKAWLDEFGEYEFVETSSGRTSRRLLPSIRNEEHFWQITAPWMLRRKADDPLVRQEIQLPPLDFETLTVPGSETQMNLYYQAQEDFVRWVEEQRQLEEADPDYTMRVGVAIKKMWALRKLASVPCVFPAFTEETWPKMEMITRLAENAVQQGHKVVLFSSMYDLVDEVTTHLAHLGVVIATGQQSISERTESVKMWKSTPDLHVLNCTMQAMNLGATLSLEEQPVTVILANEEWSPDDMQQAIKRAHRITTRWRVPAYLALTEGTIDMDIHELVEAKERLAALALDHEWHQAQEMVHVPSMDEFINRVVATHYERLGQEPPKFAQGLGRWGMLRPWTQGGPGWMECLDQR